MSKVLIVDDDEIIIESLKIMLENFSIDVEGYSDSITGRDVALVRDFDLILIDLKMPVMDGSEISIEILKRKPDARILIITSSPMDPLIEKALESGVLGVVKKPFEIGKILSYLEKK